LSKESDIAKIMTYQQDIIKRLSKSGYWPEFERRDFLSELDGIAEDAFMHETLEGYLGALLIYSQLAEEMIRLLLKDIEFLTQLRSFPNEYHSDEKKIKPTLGDLIGALEKTIDFNGKDMIIAHSQDINQFRNELVHNLTKHTDTELIVQKVELVKDLYFAMLKSYGSAHFRFREEFEKISKDKVWLEKSQLYNR
jgi:hypothetical protein